MERTKSELQDVGLWSKVAIQLSEPDNEDRVRGCYNSHIAVLQRALKEVKKQNFCVLVLEDNLEKTLRISTTAVESVKNFVRERGDWDIIHLAYMMYVPDLCVSRLPDWDENVVKVNGGPNAALGTTAYLISRKAVEQVLTNHAANGYKEPIPNVISKLFQYSRYGAYPMPFHRASKVASLVNPQVQYATIYIYIYLSDIHQPMLYYTLLYERSSPR